MEWTSRQREQIILAYARDGLAFCPDDLSLLVIGAESAAIVKRCGVNLCCPTCERQLNRSTMPVDYAPTSAKQPERSA